MEWLGFGDAEMTQSQVIGWAAGIATAVATVVTAALTFWFRLIDRPKARFEIVPMYSGWNVDQFAKVLLPTAGFRIYNVGTGAARRVSLIGIHCVVSVDGDASSIDQNNIALSEVGDEISIAIYISPSRWQTTRLLVTWAEPRNWFFGERHRHVEFTIASYLKEPELRFTIYESNSDTRKELEQALQGLIRQRDSELELIEVPGYEHEIQFVRWWRRRKLARAGWRWRRLPSMQVLEQGEGTNP